MKPTKTPGMYWKSKPYQSLGLLPRQDGGSFNSSVLPAGWNPVRFGETQLVRAPLYRRIPHAEGTGSLTSSPYTRYPNLVLASLSKPAAVHPLLIALVIGLMAIGAWWAWALL